jgi:hypothetical protein
MSLDPEAWEGRPALVCSRLLACEGVRYDADNPDTGCSLDGVIVHVRLPRFPARVRRVCLFAQMHGTPGEYVLRVRLVRIGVDEDGDAVEAAQVAVFGPWEIELPGENYVECYGLVMTAVPFDEPSVYEFQLFADDQDGMLMNERVEARV